MKAFAELAHLVGVFPKALRQIAHASALFIRLHVAIETRIGIVEWQQSDGARNVVGKGQTDVFVLRFLLEFGIGVVEEEKEIFVGAGGNERRSVCLDLFGNFFGRKIAVLQNFELQFFGTVVIANAVSQLDDVFDEELYGTVVEGIPQRTGDVIHRRRLRHERARFSLRLVELENETLSKAKGRMDDGSGI